MSVSRLTYISKIGVEQMGDLSDNLKDPDVLRLENLDTDLRPPQSALEFTKYAVDDRANCWIIDDSAMERILYDGRGVIHPASFSDMREKVITVGSASKEYRMIGWRVGWFV